MITLINSFSPNMLLQSRVTLDWSPTSLKEIQRLMEEHSYQSYMGQANVANIFSRMTGMDVPVNRKPYYIRTDDLVIQVQYIGPYFDDSATELPESGRFAYWKIQPIELKASFRIGQTHILTHTYGD